MTEVARLAIDIGGTFTDAALAVGDGDDGDGHGDGDGRRRLFTAKTPTTPRAPGQGFLAAARLVLEAAGVAPASVTRIIHGTTLATNALIERRGARTALVTTRGFRDSLEIGYESRHDQYDINLTKPPPLVPRRRRLTVDERVGADGKIIRALSEDDLHALLPKLTDARVESIAIGFLHSYINDAHEKRAAEFLQRHLPEVSVTRSAQVCPELREYERLSTAAANAFVMPVMRRYLATVRDDLDAAGLRCPLLLMASNGGMVTLGTALRFPIRLVESGPSGGAILARTVAKQCDESAALSYDMGGTTAKVCLLENFAPRTARQFEVARSARFTAGSGLPLRVPVLEMIEIGAGGGSVASVDALGRITVGPASAGAEPGPACYARGGERATVTDADLTLGKLDAEKFAEGRIKLQPSRARDAINNDIAAPLGIGVDAAAAGVCEMVDESMANAARVHAAEHGADLARFTMIAFGGCGPLHAARVAQKLNLRRVIIPRNPSVGSALGFLLAPAVFEQARSLHQRLSAFDAGAVQKLFVELAADARAAIADAADDAPLTESRSALMRYRGQGHELEVKLPDDGLDAADLRARFEKDYARIYKRTLAGGDVEALSWNLKVSTPPAVVSGGDDGDGHGDDGDNGDGNGDDGDGDGDDGDSMLTRAKLSVGDVVAGPAMIVEPQTTVVVPSGASVRIDRHRNLIMEW